MTSSFRQTTSTDTAGSDTASSGTTSTDIARRGLVNRVLGGAGAVLAVSALAVGATVAGSSSTATTDLDDVVLRAAAVGDVTLLPDDAPVEARLTVLDAGLVDVVDDRLAKHRLAASDQAFVAEVDTAVVDEVDAALAAAEVALTEQVDARYAEQVEAAEEARRAAEAAAAAAREAEEQAARERAAAAAAAAPAPAVSGGGVWDQLAMCESTGRWDYNGGSGYDGGLQFHPQTWSAYAPAGYPAYAYQASRAQQIAVAEQVLAAQGWGAWPACSAKLGLR